MIDEGTEGVEWDEPFVLAHYEIPGMGEGRGGAMCACGQW